MNQGIQEQTKYYCHDKFSNKDRLGFSELWRLTARRYNYVNVAERMKAGKQSPSFGSFGHEAALSRKHWPTEESVSAKHGTCFCNPGTMILTLTVFALRSFLIAIWCLAVTHFCKRPLREPPLCRSEAEIGGAGCLSFSFLSFRHNLLAKTLPDCAGRQAWQVF